MFIPRVAGLIAHLVESIDDPEYKIFRPRQIFTGSDLRKYEDFPKQDDNISPEIVSQNLQYFRPGFELPSINDDVYDDLDFDKQFAAIKESSGTHLGSRIRSWLSTKQSQKNLRISQTLKSSTSVPNAKDESPSKVSLDSVKMVKDGITKSDSTRPNLLAGSTHSRVISSPPPK